MPAGLHTWLSVDAKAYVARIRRDGGKGFSLMERPLVRHGESRRVRGAHDPFGDLRQVARGASYESG